MSHTDRVLRELRISEESDLLSKVACDVLRILTILGGSAWESELSDRLLELWSQDHPQHGDPGRLQAKTEEALKILGDKGIITSKRMTKADLSTQSQREEMLHSARNYSSLVSLFGSDKQVLKYRGQT